jgi:hypothetical protein
MAVKILKIGRSAGNQKNKINKNKQTKTKTDNKNKTNNLHSFVWVTLF